MEANRRVGTKPERALRSALHAQGLRFRNDHPLPLPNSRPTRADVVFPRARVAVFVDGCFWHSCPDHGLTPKANADYWVPKLARNRERDRLVTEALASNGWTVIRVWEHESVTDAAERVAAAVRAATARCPNRG